MLVHEIEKYTSQFTPTSSRKPRFVNGSAQHREYIFKRTLDSVINDPNYHGGKSIILKRNKLHGTIIAIEDEFQFVGWEGLKCQFIDVWLHDSDKTILVHPSEITFRNKRK